MKKLIAGLSVLSLVLIFSIHDASAKDPVIQSFKAGGRPIALVPPTSEMAEMGYDNRELMEIFVAQTNRLIAAYAMKKDIPGISRGDQDLVLEKYAMVQVPRRAEYMDVRPEDFEQVTAGAKQAFGDTMGTTLKEVEDEFNRRMKALDLDEATMRLGKPVQLGCLFSKKDAYAFGMIMPLTMGNGEKLKMGMGATVMRVRNRLLYVYLYAQYKDENTVRWLKKTTEAWANAILKANR